MRNKNIGKHIFLGLLFAFLLLPVLGTVLFSVAGRWDVTVLPKGLTLKYYAAIFSDSEFIFSMIRSIVITAVAAFFAAIVIVPCIFLGVVHYPKLIKVFEILAVLPFVMPGVVLAIGLIELYSSLPIDITGTVWILLGSYFVFCLPFTFQTIRNSFRSIDAKSLVEAALVLGYSESAAFVKIILPGIARGVITAMLLDISMLFGDFVLVNLLVGSGYETVQMYLFNQLSKDGHIASAVVTVYLLVIFAISILTFLLATSKTNRNKVKS